MALTVGFLGGLLLLVVLRRRRRRAAARDDTASAALTAARGWTGPASWLGRPATRLPRQARP